MPALREPAVAGHFYPADAERCARQVRQLLGQGDGPPVAGYVVGGLVPHAGWMCSGQVAARTFQAIARSGHPETIVLFGAVHYPCGPRAAVYDRGGWRTPLGEVGIDEDLAAAILEGSEACSALPEAHRLEHSIEVQVPFVQEALPGVRIVPVMVPPTEVALRVGIEAAEAAQRIGRRVCFVASSDLTHYGPRYHFTPQGLGPAALAWAKQVNDRRLLERVEALDAAGVLAEAQEHLNACGAGAIAAAIEASRAMGADRAVLLEHTTSYEVLGPIGGDDTHAVGYASAVFVAPAER